MSLVDIRKTSEKCPFQHIPISGNENTFRYLMSPIIFEGCNSPYIIIVRKTFQVLLFGEKLTLEN